MHVHVSPDPGPLEDAMHGAYLVDLSCRALAIVEVRRWTSKHMLKVRARSQVSKRKAGTRDRGTEQARDRTAGTSGLPGCHQCPNCRHQYEARTVTVETLKQEGSQVIKQKENVTALIASHAETTVLAPLTKTTTQHPGDDNAIRLPVSDSLQLVLRLHSPFSGATVHFSFLSTTRFLTPLIYFF